MSVPTALRCAYRGDETLPGGAMSAQPDHAPASPAAPAPTAQLLAQLREATRAGTWVPAFE